MSEIPSIYAPIKDNSYPYQDKMIEHQIDNRKISIWNPRGVREKILDIQTEENKHPLAKLHANVEKYLYSDQPILNSTDVIRVLGKEIVSLSREKPMIILMNEEGFPLAISNWSIGTENLAQLSFRELLKMILLVDAKQVVIAHNHPYVGDDYEQFYPSKEDYISFQDTYCRLQLFGVDLVDSVIVSQRFCADTGTDLAFFYSLKEQKIYELGTNAEHYGYEYEKTRVVQHNHTQDFDIHGHRINHMGLSVTADGINYEGEEK